MESVTLKASLRENTGKKSSKTIRSQEAVPCILYGGNENVNFIVTEKDFRDLVYTPLQYVINLDISGKTYNAILKDMQFHPVTDKLIHADFYEVSEEKVITIDIPIKLTGSSIGVREGGKLVMDKRKITVKGQTKNIPAEIEIDITSLGIGKSIRAGEIPTDQYEVVLSKDTPVISVKTTRAAAAAALEAGKQG